MADEINEPAGGAFERLKGKAKEVAGAVLGNDALKREGRLHEEKADAVEEAGRLDRQAAQERAEAAVTARERQLAVEQQRLAAEASAETREARLERERIESEAWINREHAHEAIKVERQGAAAEAALDADEVRAARERAEQVREAARIERAAHEARATAELLDTDSSTEK